MSARRLQCQLKPTSRQVRASSRNEFTSASSPEEPFALPPVVDAQLLGGQWPAVCEDGLGHLLDRDVAEVQVGRQAAGMTGIGRGRATSGARRSHAVASSGTACRRAFAAGAPPGVPATGGTDGSRGKRLDGSPEVVRDSRSRTGRVLARAASGMRGLAAARWAQASAKALWMRRPEVGGRIHRRAQKGQGHHASCESTAKTGDRGLRRARASLCPGTMKQGKSSVTTSEARVGQPAKQPRRGLVLCLHERPVVETQLGRGRVALARMPSSMNRCSRRDGPGVVEAQALVDHERLLHLARAPQRVVEGVVVVETPIGLHPVEDVARPPAFVLGSLSRRRRAWL